MLRVAHVTDVHITKDRDSPKGGAAMFEHMLGRKNPHVKLCVSGHMHTCDRCECRGVVRLRRLVGRQRVRLPALFADGAFGYDFVDSGWRARKWKGKELK